jgi:hypothetical protein
MQNVGVMAEYDPANNIVYINEGEYHYLTTDDQRAAAVRHAHQMPVRTKDIPLVQALAKHPRVQGYNL